MPEKPLVVLVVGILAAVSEACRPGDLLSDEGALDEPEIVKLFLQHVVAVPGDNHGVVHRVLPFP